MHFNQDVCYVTDGWSWLAAYVRLNRRAKPLCNFVATASGSSEMAPITRVKFEHNLFRPTQHLVAASFIHLVRFIMMFQSMVVLYTINLHLKHPGHLRSATLSFRVH